MASSATSVPTASSVSSCRPEAYVKDGSQTEFEFKSSSRQALFCPPSQATYMTDIKRMPRMMKQTTPSDVQTMPKVAQHLVPPELRLKAIADGPQAMEHPTICRRRQHTDAA